VTREAFGGLLMADLIALAFIGLSFIGFGALVSALARV
jgi:hypothetical protein